MTTCSVVLRRGRRAGEDPAAVVEDRHAIAQLADEREIVLDEHDQTPGLGDPAHERAQSFALGIGQARGRLVEQEHVRRADERAGDFDEVPRAVRKRGDRLSREVGDAGRLERLAHACREAGERSRREQAEIARRHGQLLRRQADGHVVEDGQRLREADLLKRAADAQPRALVDRQPIDALAAQARCSPASIRLTPVMQPMSVDLPAPFGPMSPCTSPAVPAKSTALQRLHAAEALGDAAQLEDHHINRRGR